MCVGGSETCAAGVGCRAGETERCDGPTRGDSTFGVIMRVVSGDAETLTSMDAAVLSCLPRFLRLSLDQKSVQRFDAIFFGRGGLQRRD